jgi:hypothetical protein
MIGKVAIVPACPAFRGENPALARRLPDKWPPRLRLRATRVTVSRRRQPQACPFAKQPQTSPNHLENVMNYQSCIEACQQCIVDCQNCLGEMILQESDNDCPKCCIECAEICELCVRLMARDGKFTSEICRICAEVCEWCAEQCGAHKHEHCQRCAKSCRRCAEECRAMAGQSA